jgi:2-methylisocitrate lyase-like PEP mutase family enzyme
MSVATQIQKAAAFRQLHDGKCILALPNAWDAVSARIFEEAGFPAVATTSAGVAWALGYPDGERVDRAEMLAAVGRIARSVAVPVTADIEAGFGNTLAELAETVKEVIAAGAVGINLEDSDKRQDKALIAVEAAVARIQAARDAADRTGVPLVINARTDVYLAAIGESAERFDHAVRRANAYREAGADCLFVPAVRDGDTIGRLVRALHGPLNILAGPGCPPTTELQSLGVCRLSVGSGPMTAALTLVRRIAEELKSSGTFAAFTQGSVPYAEWNRLMGDS